MIAFSAGRRWHAMSVHGGHHPSEQEPILSLSACCHVSARMKPLMAPHLLQTDLQRCGKIVNETVTCPNFQTAQFVLKNVHGLVVRHFSSTSTSLHRYGLLG